MSFRNVEELLAVRGIEISYEPVRRWVLKFGCTFARNIRRCRPCPTGLWHLDEMIVMIKGKKRYLWRAVDALVAHNPLTWTYNSKTASLVAGSQRREWWARQDSNLQPDGYEPSALTS